MNSQPHAIRTCMNSTPQLQSINTHLLEDQRFSLALRGSYSEIYELNIATNMSTLIFSNIQSLMPVGVNNLVATETIINSAIHPDDRAHVAQAFIGDALRTRFEAGVTEVCVEFRRLGAAGDYRWVSATVVPLCEEGTGVGNKTILLVKDISERKEEEHKQRVQQQYNMALRNIYDELYECNFTHDSYRIVYYVKDKHIMPPETGRISEVLFLVADTMVHPEDKKRFLQFFSMEGVRARFAQGQEYLQGEFRKLRPQGTYHWVALTMFPPRCNEGEEEVYLVFVMDIDARKRAEEITQQNLLLERQRIADERYRIIVEQTKTLVFEWSRENGSSTLTVELPFLLE